MKRLSRFIVVLVATLLGLFASLHHPCHASPPPYQPPLDLSEEPMSVLLRKLSEGTAPERESAAYYLGPCGHLAQGATPEDTHRVYEAVKQAWRGEEDDQARQAMWVVLVGVVQFEGLASSGGSRYSQHFGDDKDFWLAALQERETATSVLSLVRDFEVDWADEAIVRALSHPDDPNGSIRIHAAKCVERLRIPEAEPVLREIIRGPLRGSLEGFAAKALAQIGSREVIPELQQLRKRTVANGWSVADIDIAIEWLEVRTEPDSARREEGLIEMARAKHAHQIDAIGLLGETGSTNGLPVLLDVMSEDERWAARHEAARAIGVIAKLLPPEPKYAGIRRAILAQFRSVIMRPEGQGAIGDRNAAIEALIHLDWREGTEIVRAGLHQRSVDAHVREAAEQWLEERLQPHVSAEGS